MRYLIAILSLLLGTTSLSAQETLLLEESEPQPLKEDYNKLLPKKINPYIDANTFLSNGLYNFRRSILRNDEVIFVYSLFPVSAYEGLYAAMEAGAKSEGKDFGFQDYQNNFAPLVNGFFENKAFHEPLYAAILPLYQKEFKQFSEPEAQAVLDKLNEALSYAQSFDLQKEDARFAKESAFRVGKIKAFVYRRIKKKQLTQKECIDWLQRIIKDLKAAFPDDGSKSYKDQYVLHERFMGYVDEEEKYIWGKRFGDKHKELFVKRGDQYATFFPKGTNVVKVMRSYGEMNGMKLITSEKEGKYQYHLFRKIDNRIVAQEVKVSGKVKKFTFNYFDCIRIDYEDGSMGFYDVQNNKELLVEGEIEKAEFMTALNMMIIQRENGAAGILYKPKEKLIFSPLKGKIKGLKNIDPFADPFLDDPWEDEYTVFSTPVYILEYENGKRGFIYLMKNRFVQADLPGDYNYTSISEFTPGHFLVEIDVEEEGTKQGLLFENGEWILEPKYVSILDLGQIFLVSKLIKGREYFAFVELDVEPKFLTGFEYEKPNLYISDPESFSEGYQEQIVINKDEQTVLLAKNIYDQEGISYTQHLLLNFEGQPILSEKYGYVARLNDYSAETDYYKVAKKARLDDRVRYDPASKMAVFNSQGEQITKFKYDHIELVWPEVGWDDFEEVASDPYFECTRKGKTVQLDLFGEPLEE